jgi:serine/threonine-protein kinase
MTPTAVGIVMGTAGYLAPEQARGQPDQIDARTDLFAVGAVLFRALSGKRIHEQANAFDMMFAAMKDPAPSLATVLPGAAPALLSAVDRALAFDKQSRWQSAREMFDALGVAYREDQARPAGAAPTPSGAPPAPESPSLVVEVTFGGVHDEALERERQRTREVVEGLSSLSVAIDSDSLRGR